jgi:hypothetical protein
MAILTTSTRAPKSLARADFIGRWRTYVPGTGHHEALSFPALATGKCQ